MKEPIYLSYHPTLDDLTDGSLAVYRVARPFARLVMRTTLVVLAFCVLLLAMLILGNPNRAAKAGDKNLYVFIIYVFLLFILILVMSKPFIRFRVARQFKGSPLLKSLLEWWISDEELVSATFGSEGHYRWEMVKRIVETQRCFVMGTHMGLHVFLPCRAFHSREDVNRFIALAREKAPKYDVIKAIEYEPGLDEKPASSSEL